jgi:hypothetical protein
MHTSSKNFRACLSAAVLAALTLVPAIHALGSPVRTEASAVRAEAKAPAAFEMGAAHYEVGTFVIRVLTNHVVEPRSESTPTLTALGQVLTVYGPDDCFRDCVRNSRDYGFWEFCAKACA